MTIQTIVLSQHYISQFPSHVEICSKTTSKEKTKLEWLVSSSTTIQNANSMMTKTSKLTLYTNQQDGNRLSMMYSAQTIFFSTLQNILQAMKQRTLNKTPSSYIKSLSHLGVGNAKTSILLQKFAKSVNSLLLQIERNQVSRFYLPLFQFLAQHSIYSYNVEALIVEINK